MTLLLGFTKVTSVCQHDIVMLPPSIRSCDFWLWPGNTTLGKLWLHMAPDTGLGSSKCWAFRLDWAQPPARGHYTVPVAWQGTYMFLCTLFLLCIILATLIGSLSPHFLLSFPHTNKTTFNLPPPIISYVYYTLPCILFLFPNRDTK